jgi:hypothetical protein
MDILLFDKHTAEESIEFALREKDPDAELEEDFRAFETDVVPAIREALANKDKHPPEHYLKSLLRRIRKQAGRSQQGRKAKRKS